MQNRKKVVSRMPLVVLSVALGQAVLGSEPEMKTREGTPVVRMWQCSMPQADKDGAGFPALKGAQHSTIFSPTRETGGYNHHSQLVWHKGKFHAMWSNHPYAEDAAGMRVLEAGSPDGKTWSQFRELFPPPGPVGKPDKLGALCAAGGWIVDEDRLFAVASCDRVAFFFGEDKETGKEIFADVRDAAHPYPKDVPCAPFVREVLPDGDFGPILVLDGEVPPDLPFSTKRVSDVNKALATRISNLYLRGDRIPSPALLDLYPCLLAVPSQQEILARNNTDRLIERPKGTDGHHLCEPTIYRLKTGERRMLLRDGRYSHRLYVSSYDSEHHVWQAGRPTDIPDSPSQSVTLSLPDGTVLLIGNQMSPKFDNWDEIKHYDRNPLTIAVSDDGKAFTRVYALRSGIPELRVKGIFGGGSGGAQYPSAVVKNGTLFVQYSLAKHDIAFSMVSLKDIGVQQSDSEQSPERDSIPAAR